MVGPVAVPRVRVFAFALIILVALGWAYYFLVHQDHALSGSGTGTPTLRIMTYGSFILPSGPGPLLQQEFEKSCQCRVEYVDGDDSALFLEKLAQFPDRQIDLVLGLSFIHLARAQAKVAWRRLKWPAHVVWSQRMPDLSLLKSESSTEFVPVAWSPMTFIYRQGEVTPPASWEDLSQPQWQKTLTTPDPRFSVSGVHLVAWVFNSESQALDEFRLKTLQHAVLSVAPSWSASYGLFRQKNAQLTFSYATSPVYHWQQDQDLSYRPAVFTEGHPYEVELAAIPLNCQQCELAERFVEFLLQATSQRVLMEKNYMLPVVEGVEQGTPFAELPKFPLLAAGDLQKLGADEAKWSAEFAARLQK